MNLPWVPTLILGFRDCSYKFHRLFPLSQYDLPSHNSKLLSFSSPARANRSGSISNAYSIPSSTATEPTEAPSTTEAETLPIKITPEEISATNPHVDYTRCIILSLGRVNLHTKCRTLFTFQARLNFAGIFRCRKPDAGGCEPISGWHVRWLKSCAR